MQKWFSTHPEAIKELESLVIILEHSGYDLKTLVDNKNEFTEADATKIIRNAASKAWEDKLPVVRSSFNNKASLLKKVEGVWYFEYLFDAVINSRRFEPLLPSGWVASIHRAEFDIPESDTGNPDRVLLNSKNKPVVALSLKHSNDWKAVPKGLEKAFFWVLEKQPNHAQSLGSVPLKVGLFTTGKNKQGMTWSGGLVSSDVKGNSVQDLLNKNTETTLTFWKDFFREIKGHIEHYHTSKVLGNPNAKVPDQYQKKMIVNPISNHFGPGIANAPTGIGKTICQIAVLPKTRSINLYMAGARLALASQADEEMTCSLQSEDHRAYVMSKFELEKQVGRHLARELSHRVSLPMDLAVQIYNYVQNNDKIPFNIIAIEQSLWKVAKALEIIKDGELVDPDTNELFNWCLDKSKVNYYWNKTVKLLHDAHYDEAHNLVTGEIKGDDASEIRRKTQMIEKLMWFNQLFERSIYWTATIKLNGSKYDMSNKSIFGEVIAVVRPADAIERAYIVPPMLIPVRLSSGELIESGMTINDEKADKELTYYVKSLEDAYQRCKEDGIPCRVIIFTSGTQYHEAFKQKIIEHYADKGQKIWCDYVEAETDAETRKDMFKQFGSADFSVMLNYGIVSEGINIPSCSGVILGRFMSAVQLVQAIGRAMRIIDADRKDLVDKKLVPGEWWTYRKKYGLVYTFVEADNADSITNEDLIISILRELRDVNNGEPWWIGPDGGRGVRARGKPEGDYKQPQDGSSDDSEAEYDDKLSKLMIIDPEEFAYIEKIDRQGELIASLDLNDTDVLKKLRELVLD